MQFVAHPTAAVTGAATVGTAAYCHAQQRLYLVRLVYSAYKCVIDVFMQLAARQKAASAVQQQQQQQRQQLL